MKDIKCYSANKKEAENTEVLEIPVYNKVFTQEDVDDYLEIRKLIKDYEAGKELPSDVVTKIEVAQSIDIESLTTNIGKNGFFNRELRHLLCKLPHPTEVHIVLECGLSIRIGFDDFTGYIYEVKELPQ